MGGANQLLLCFYGDDFTGSTDALESLARAGIRTALFLEPPTPERLATFPGLQAVGVAGMTRAMSPPAMEAVLRPALSRLRSLGAPHVHYKVCSTFDSSPAVGSIGCVIDLAAEIFRARFVPLLVGAPALGRYCVFGHLFARFGQEGEPFRLDRHPSMSRHPVTPADESDLRLHLARQTTKQIGLFDILKVSLPADQARAALEAALREKQEVLLFDVLYEEQLELLGQLIDTYAGPREPLFSVGSSGIEAALAAHWLATGRIKRRKPWTEAGRAEPLLVAAGSCSPVTARQIEWALEQGFGEVALDTMRLAADDKPNEVERQATEAAVKVLKSGRSVIVHTSKGDADPRLAPTADALARRGMSAPDAAIRRSALLGGALGRVVRQAVEKTGVRRLVVAGGDTAGQVAQALGIEALEMIAPLAPGAPLCRARATGSPADGLEVCFKGGQIGRPDFFGAAASGRGA